MLLPPSLRDWLPEDHLAYFVSDVVEQLDLSAIESVYEEEERGQPPYHPADDDQDFDLWLLCRGVFLAPDAEEVERGCGFSGVGSGEPTGFPERLSDFRKLHLGALQGLFDQVLQIALQAGTM